MLLQCLHFPATLPPYPPKKNCSLMVVKFIFFSISILAKVKISLPIFICENKLFMFYVPLFSEPLMFKLAISLTFIQIVNKS